MDKIQILWVDDEIDLLKPHIIFLEQKGYKVFSANNGADALELFDTEQFDLVFLDENMPGMSGLEALQEIKKIHPHLPVIMITKSEEESIMEDAIGGNIADYLIKPVNPKQILLSIKKNLDGKKIIDERNTQSYQMEFRQIGMDLSSRMNAKDWDRVYRKLVDYELKLEKSDDGGIQEILEMQKSEANSVFSNFVEDHYVDWLHEQTDDRPLQSHRVMREKVLPALEEDKSTFLFLIDNLRFDQWKAIYPVINEFFRVDSEEIYQSILPTTTQYARNAFFSGLMPSEIEKKYPQYWIPEHAEGSKNQFEYELLQTQLKRLGKDIKSSYHKILNLDAGRRLLDNMHSLLDKDLNVIVYNFVDMLSHARTDMEVIRELASDEKAYRSLTLSWFENSPLYEMMRYVAEKGHNMVITTDHGSVRVAKPVKVLGDRNTNSNLRYKFGKSLEYNRKEVFEVRKPSDVLLPRVNVSTSYIFCKTSDYFVYPNNYNHYANYYRDTFQHGGISMEEMMIPLIFLKAR